MSDEARWYVIHTYSGYENKVAANIEKAVENRKLFDQIFAVKVPVETVVEVTGDNKQKEVERKVFPGYVLVKMIMNDESWHVIRNIRGCTGFVGPGSKPVALTEEEVLALGIDKKEVVVSYEVGDNVRITDGPLKDFVGIVTELSPTKNRVNVTVNMFGRETPVELEMTQVEAI